MLTKLAMWNMFTSIFAFGGGSSLLSYLYDVYIIKLHILTDHDFLKISVISQILPGPVALSFLAIVGFKVQAFIGWFVSIISFTLFTAIASLLFYKHAFKLKILDQITKYLIPVIICSLVVMTTILCKIPFTYAQTNYLKLSQILFLTILSIVLVWKKVSNIKVIGINICFALIFVFI